MFDRPPRPIAPICPYARRHILGLKFVEIDSASNHGLVLPADLDLTEAAVVLTAGTVTTGAVDNPTQAAGAAWVHVDAAWGGPLRFSERFADVLDGVESADSVGFSAHKWCFQPKGTAVVLFKDDKAAHEALSYGGGYLSAPNIGLLGSGPATALPFLASLLAWGREGLAERVEHGMAQAASWSNLWKTTRASNYGDNPPPALSSGVPAMLILSRCVRA